MLIDGVWHKNSPEQAGFGPLQMPPPSRFAGRVTTDGQPGPDGRSFPVAAGRYHLVVAMTCPFAQRALAARAKVGLTNAVSVDVVEPVLGEEGWSFAVAPQRPSPNSTYERLYGSAHLRQLYVRANPHFTGRVSVPVLWDTQGHTIVSNESAEIVAMFEGPLAALAGR